MKRLKASENIYNFSNLFGSIAILIAGYGSYKVVI